MLINITIFLTVCLNIVFGGNILAILGVNFRSHFQVIDSVVKLAANYHHVTFYLPEELHYKHPNITMKNVLSPNRFLNFSMGTLLENACDYDTYSLFYKYILTDNSTIFDTIFAENDVRELLVSKEKYDVLIMSGYGTEHFVQVTHTMKIPVIQVIPSLLFPWHNEHIDNLKSWISDFSFVVTEKPNCFWGRLDKFVKNILLWYRYKNLHMNTINQVTQKHFPLGTPDVESLLERTDLIFVNTRSVMGYARPSVQTAVEIGGLHCMPAKPLPADLEEFVNGSGEHGVIYFSLGTVVQGFTMPAHLKNTIINTFARLKQRVIWKWAGEMDNVPPNVKLVKWAPQQDILGHKKMKLLITQGGMLSMQEAIYHGVPTLVIPVLFDQYTNSYVAQEKGYSKTMNFCEFTEDIFYLTIMELIGNKKYIAITRSLSAILKDQLQSTKAKIKWWIEFVIKHNGTSELRPLDKHKFWETHIPYDIIMFLIAITAAVLVLFMVIIYYVVRLYNRQATSQKTKEL